MTGALGDRQILNANFQEAPAERPKGRSLHDRKHPRTVSSDVSLGSALPLFHRRHTDNVGMDLQACPKRWHVTQVTRKRVAILFSQ